ncbi:MAG: M20/M25/M40 family metallo-hydrolase, partial [Bacteroidota bacterium]|nr:M20/M25/M40 family metallo-hydrolase [Bacteroidota bacterium]
PGTGDNGVRARVIEVQTVDELRAMPDSDVKGKIVFFGRPMDTGLPSTFSAYGGAADQRYSGPSVAAKKGVVAAVVRSLSTTRDDFPHTGLTLVADTLVNIPSVAISTNDADKLSKAIKLGSVEIFIRTTCQMLGEVTSYNVIGEITGSQYPDEIILIGGHLDSWDVGEGAQDDGAGSVHSIESLYRLLKMGYKPKRTLRCVLFMNEESGLEGGKKYAAEAIAKNEYHMAAIESDGGAGVPQGFGLSAGGNTELDKMLAYMNSYTGLLEPYNIQIKAGGGGADIGPLKPTAGLLIGLRPENSKYFDYHHSELDVLETVHPRELSSGSAAIASFIYLIDQYGIGK